MLPELVKKSLISWFNYQNSEIFCQVSTMTDKPGIRTMKLYDITADGRLVFITNVHTKKWKELQICSKVALCFVDIQKGQLIAKGQCDLQIGENISQENLIYWEKLPLYWKNYYTYRSQNKELSSGEIPTSFGIILITPTYWEVLELNQEDYLKSLKVEFHLKKKAWESREVSPS